jgi:hypothetical protein
VNQTFLASQTQFKPTQALVVERSSSQVEGRKSEFCASSNALPEDEVVGPQFEVGVGRSSKLVKGVATESEEDSSCDWRLAGEGQQDESESSRQDLSLDVAEKVNGLGR